MFRQLTALLALSATTATAALSGPRSVSGSELTLRVPGSRIDIDTPIGTRIPMTFGHDGIVSGEAGVLAAFLGSAKDRGRWWVTGDRLCIKWFRWFEGQRRCMEIKLDGARVFWTKDDGEAGTGTLTLAPRPAETVAAPPSAPVASKAPARPTAPQPAGTGAPTAAAAITEVAAAPQAAAAPTATQTAATQTKAAPPPSALGGPGDPAAEPGKSAPAKAAYPRPFTPMIRAPAPKPAGADVAAAPAADPAQPAAQEKPQSSPPAKSAAPAAAVSSQKSGSASPAKPPFRPQGPSFRVANVDVNDMLNVRSGPSESFRAVGVIAARGRGVVVTGPCQGEWCPIRHGGVTGWVNRYYLIQEDAVRRAP